MKEGAKVSLAQTLPHTCVRLLAHSLAKILGVILFLFSLACPLCLWRWPRVLSTTVTIPHTDSLYACQALLPGGQVYHESACPGDQCPTLLCSAFAYLWASRSSCLRCRFSACWF